MNVSVIVPTIGRPDSLRRLLESIVTQTVQPTEVIIADGSADTATQQILDDPRWIADGLRVLRVAVQPPHAVRQRNAAIAHSSGDLLFFLDDDIVLETDCLQRLMESLIDRPDAVAVMGTFSNQPWPQPTRIWRWYLRWCLGIRNAEWQGRVLGPLLRFGFEPMPDGVRPCDWLGAGNSLIQKASFQKVGGFSDFFLHRCTMNEDVDLGLKLSRVGPVLFCSTARMAHHHAAGGRLSPDQVAEDDLHNRFLILHRTRQLSKSAALSQIVLFLVLETAGNAAGALLRRQMQGLWPLFVGRLRAVKRVRSTYF
jgi:GT2 family glycosyltransferase